jgi:hypothetical protein
VRWSFCLIRLGYPLAIIQKRDRSRYLAALGRADVGDTGLLGEFLARNILDTLDRYIVPAVAGPIRLVPLTALADAGIKPSALREAALRGRLRATRDDQGRWLSTRKWVQEYKQSRRPGGRKPKS